MKIQYQLHTANTGERALMRYLLLDRVERQRWYAVIFLKLWNTEGLICTQ